MNYTDFLLIIISIRFDDRQKNVSSLRGQVYIYREYVLLQFVALDSLHIYSGATIPKASNRQCDENRETKTRIKNIVIIIF